MKKIIESRKLDYSLLALFALLAGLSFINHTVGQKALVIVFMLVTVFYMVRMLYSFSQWKFSKGISSINFLLNFQIFYSLLAICYAVCQWPGYSAMLKGATGSFVVIVVVIGFFVLAKWVNLNKSTYWAHLNENTAKAIIGTAICAILFIID